MDLAERVGTGRRVEGHARVVPLEVAVPAGPPSLAAVQVEVRAVGNTLLGVSSEATGQRSPAFWRALPDELHAFLGTDPCAAELGLVAHVIRGFGDHPVGERLVALITDILEGRLSLPPSPVTATRAVGTSATTARADG